MIAADCNLGGPIALGVIGLAIAGYAFVSSLLVNREARRDLDLARRIRDAEARERRSGGIRQVPPE